MGAKLPDAPGAAARIRFVTGWRNPVAAGRGRFHSHGDWEIIYHARGSGRAYLESGETFDFDVGSAELMPPGLRHTQEMRSAGEDVCLHLSWALPRGRARSGPISVARIDDECLLREIEALGSAQPDVDPLVRDVCDHRVAAVLMGLLRAAKASEPGPGRPELRHARRAYEHVLENCAEIETVEQVAQAVGIGPDHLRHVFRRSYGMSLKAWLVEARIRRARSLLASSELPLKAVAELCGFDNARYFSTSFHRAVGLPPGRFRESLRNRSAEPSADRA